MLVSAFGGAWRWLRVGRRWLIPVVAICGLLSVLAVREYRSAVRERNAAEAAAQAAQQAADDLSAARIADDLATSSTNTRKERIRAHERQASARTEDALAANPDWASQPIPPDVLDSLRD